MTYFKIIKDNVAIGVITSNDFMRYISITDCFVRADEQTGEYVSYNGKFYRATWMQPIIALTDYTEAQIIAISKEGYDIYKKLMDKQDALKEEVVVKEFIEEPEANQEIQISPIDTASVEFARSLTLNNIYYECRKTIEAGFDWKDKHYSLTTQDQLNLTDLNMLADIQDEIPYHADGEEVKLYSAVEIKELAAEATKFKIYQTTYYNSLKNYVNSLQTIEEIADITYGMEIPEEYKTEALKLLEG